jgi:hypothetical protein
MTAHFWTCVAFVAIVVFPLALVHWLERKEERRKRDWVSPEAFDRATRQIARLR